MSTTSTSTSTSEPSTNTPTGPVRASAAPDPEPVLSGYLRTTVAEGRRFVDAVALGPLDAAVPTCPGWTRRDLVRHVGEIHLWAAANVAAPKPRWLDVGHITDLAPYWPDLAAGWPDDDTLLAWYLATNANLVRVLESAPHDVAAFVFLPAPSPLLMWARRQASEITIHRCDAELVAGIGPHVEPTFASDMLDELLVGFAPHRDHVAVTTDRVLEVAATDVEERWWVTLSAGGVTTSRRGNHADLTITGSAAELYLALWNRTSGDGLDLNGDAGVLDLWRTTCRVEWPGA